VDMQDAVQEAVPVESVSAWSVPPEPEKHRPWRVLGIVAAAIVVLAVIGAMAGGNKSNGTSSAGIGHAGGGSSSDVSWAAGAAATSREISSTLNTIAGDASNYDTSAAEADCAIAEGKIDGWRTAYADAPSSVRDPMNQALDAFSSSFRECADGNFSQAAANTRVGSSYIKQATDAVNALAAG
jgi:hypothetical protein